MRFLRMRNRQPELMDQPGLSEVEHSAALAALGRVNFLSFSVARLWTALRSLAASDLAQRPLVVLDLACGGGDIAIGLASRARRRKIPLTIHGCDFSPTAVRIANEASQRSGLADLKFFRLDVLKEPLPLGYDVIMCSLFLHHLDQGDAQRLITGMAAAARRAVLIDDLLRTAFGYALCGVGCRILTRSRIVQTDGPRSVKAAYSLDEVRGLVAQCGLQRARIKRHWPERFLLTWERL